MKLQKESMAPFLSIFILFTVTVTCLFLKMEVVRQGYELVSIGHAQRTAAHENSGLELHYAKLTRPQRLDYIATQRLALNRAQKNQIVLMASEGSGPVRQ